MTPIYTPDDGFHDVVVEFIGGPLDGDFRALRSGQQHEFKLLLNVDHREIPGPEDDDDVHFLAGTYRRKPFTDTMEWEGYAERRT